MTHTVGLFYRGDDRREKCRHIHDFVFCWSSSITQWIVIESSLAFDSNIDGSIENIGIFQLKRYHDLKCIRRDLWDSIHLLLGDGCMSKTHCLATNVFNRIKISITFIFSAIWFTIVNTSFVHCVWNGEGVGTIDAFDFIERWGGRSYQFKFLVPSVVIDEWFWLKFPYNISPIRFDNTFLFMNFGSDSTWTAFCGR